MNRKGASSLLAMTVAACSPSGSKLPAQQPEAVGRAFVAAIDGCGSGLAANGRMDETRIAAAGWRITARTVQKNAEQRQVALALPAALDPDEYEFSEWQHKDSAARLSLVRWHDAFAADNPDSCRLNARLDRKGSATSVMRAISARAKAAPARQGQLPRGGDFLTPRFDKAAMGTYWQMPHHDIYLTDYDDKNLAIEIIAMQDRSKLDTYSSYRPENRIPAKDPHP